MSYLNYIYVKPPINLVDGVVKDETVINLGYQIETAFENIGDIFGNLYGDGLETAKYARYFNSLSSAIGNIGELSPEEPFGIIFEDYSQVFSNNQDRKDFILDLSPIEGEESTTINIITGDGKIYQYVDSLDALRDAGDFTTVGRVLTFFIVPDGNFSILYKGTYPEFGRYEGYSPNVYPSPYLIEEELISKPLIEIMPSGRYRVTIEKTSYNSKGDSFGADLDLVFNPIIEEYISPVGDLEVPKEYVNAWRKFPYSYERMDTRAIYILNDHQFEIDTDEDLDLDLVGGDTIVFSIANINIAEMLIDLYTLVKQHNHDGSSILSTIDHEKLTDLIPISQYPMDTIDPNPGLGDNPFEGTTENLNYSKSNISGNDHPQYMHREGYVIRRADGTTVSDEGTYNNAMLGTLLMSSRDPLALYSNIENDSNQISFGSVGEGISLNLIISELDENLNNILDKPVLKLYSPHDGLFVKTEDGEGKKTKSLLLNRHELFSYGTDTVPDVVHNLALSSDSGTTFILDKEDPTLFANLKLNKLFAKDIQVDGTLEITEPDGKLIIGDVEFIPGNGLVTIIGDIVFEGGVLDLELALIDVATITDLTVDGILTITPSGSRIRFWDGTAETTSEETSMTVLDGSQIEISSIYSTKFRSPITLDAVSGRGSLEDGDEDSNIGRINGISFIDSSESSVEEYSSMYVASSRGEVITPSSAATFMEMYYPQSSNLQNNINGLWLIRNTRIPQIEKGVKYAFSDLSDAHPEATRIDDLTDWPRAKLAAGFGDFYSIRVNASNLEDKDGIQLGDYNYIFVTGEGGNCPAGMLILESLSGVAMVESGMDPNDCANVTYSPLTVGDIQSRKSIVAEDDITAGHNISAGDTISGQTLNIRGDSQIFGNERVFGDEAVDGNFSVLNESNFNADVHIAGSLNVINKAELGNLTVIGISEFGEIARFNSAVTIGDSLTVNGIAQFDGNADFRSRLTAQDTQLGDTSVTTLTSSDLLSANGGLYVSSTAQFNGNVKAESGVEISGTLIVSESVTANGINSSKDLNVAGRTSIDGEMITRSNILFGGDENMRFTSNIESQFTVLASFNGGIIVGADSQFLGDVEINGTLNSQLIDGDRIELAGGIVARGEVEARNLVVNSDAKIIGSININGSSYTKGNVTVDGALNTGGDISAGGTMTSKGGFINASGKSALNDLTLTGGLEINGDLIVSENGQFNSIDIDTDLNVSNKIYVGLGTAKEGITITPSSLIVGDLINVDDAGTMAVRYATFELTTGVTDGYSITMPEGSSAGDFITVKNDARNIQDYLKHESSYFNNTSVFNGPVIMGNTLWVDNIRSPEEAAGSGQSWVNITAKEAYYAPA